MVLAGTIGKWRLAHVRTILCSIRVRPLLTSSGPGHVNGNAVLVRIPLNTGEGDNALGLKERWETRIFI
jgi:hypothetical protein